ncbi:hypothetical protein D3C72_2003470 [compost metagenome]
MAENFTTPADARIGAGQFFTDFQVETAADQVEAGSVVDLIQIMRNAFEHHTVGVKTKADDFALMQALLDVHRQQLSIRVFPGIGFQQQGFQHRLVRRVDAFVQLPQTGAEVFFRRQCAQAAEIQPLIRR